MKNLKLFPVAVVLFLACLFVQAADYKADYARRVTIAVAAGQGTNLVTEAQTGIDGIAAVDGALITYSATTSTTSTFSLVSGSVTNSIDTEVANGTTSDAWAPPVLFHVQVGDVIVVDCGNTGLTATVWLWLD